MKKRVLAVPLALTGLGFAELYRYVFFRHKGITSLLDTRSHKDDYYIKRDSFRARLLERAHTRHEIISRRGARLVGNYYCCADKPCGKIAFIVHGYRSDGAEASGPFADYYFSRGWDIFCCDHEAHGESSGLLIGYDYFEDVDCLDWLTFLSENYGSDIQVILHGFSMGGGIVMRMSDSVPKTVKFICSDSGFSDAPGTLKPRVGPLYQPLRRFNRLVGGYDIESTDVRPHLKNARVPMLFVHGTADPTVPFEMGKEMYELCPTEKDCLFKEGVVHIECIYRAKEEYENKLDSFIERYAENGGIK